MATAEQVLRRGSLSSGASSTTTALVPIPTAPKDRPAEQVTQSTEISVHWHYVPLDEDKGYTSPSSSDEYPDPPVHSFPPAAFAACEPLSISYKNYQFCQ